MIAGKMCSKKGSIVDTVIGLASILCLAMLIHVGSLTAAMAAQSTGGVNWLDTLQYQKPQFIPLTVPDEATCPNKYYVNYSGGSGSTCSQSSPCASVQAVCGKAGTTGGPAYIYVKGNGYFSITGTCYGSAGNEIVIKPWPGDSSVSLFTGQSNTKPNIIGTNDGGALNVHHIIVDGGPNLQFDFIGTGTDLNNSETFNVGASNITVARVRIRMPNNVGPGMGLCPTYGTDWVCDSVKIINNEFYDGMHVAQGSDNEQNYGIYAGTDGPCNSGVGQITNMYIQNNIFRNLGSLGIQIEPRKSANNTIISGNAFHDLGQLSCGSKWHCRPAISIADSCGGNITNTYIYNNLMWNLASSGVWAWGAATDYIYNNSIYNYGIGSPMDTPSQAINGYNSSYRATAENNIIYAPNGTAAMGGGTYTQSNNICSSGCASAWNTNTFLSTDPNNPNFLKIGLNSNARDAGAVISIVTTDYMGASRGSTYDIGSFEYGIAPMPPALVSVQ